MIKSHWIIGVPFVLTCVLVGCDNHANVKLDQDDISLASLNRASEEFDNQDRLNLPVQSDERAWELEPCGQTPQFRSVNLTRAIRKPVDITGLAVSNESAKAIVTFRDDRRTKGERRTGGAYCDLRSGRVLSTFDLPDYASVYSIDPAGDHAILCRADGPRSRKETLYIADLAKDGGIRQWRPLCDPDVEEPKMFVKQQEIVWASFVGNDRIVTVNHASTLHVWKFPELERIGSFRGVNGWPALTPDRTKIVFCSHDMLALLDPAEPKITATRRVGPTPQDTVVAIHPEGNMIALGGNDEAVVVNLVDGEPFRISAHQMSAKPSTRLRPDFAFIGDFLHDRARLFDFDSPRSVWKLSGTQWELPQGDAYWAVVCNAKHDWMRTKTPKEVRSELILRSFRIPYKDIRTRINKTYAATDVFALRAGDTVKIDVSGMPAEDREKTRRTLAVALVEQQFFPADESKITVKAFVDPVKEFEAIYSTSILSVVFGDNLPDDAVRLKYRGQHAHLQFKKGPRVLWSRSGMEKPPRHLKKEELPSGSQMKFFASPKYSIFSESRLPDFLPGDYAGPLGKTTFYVNEVRSSTNRPRR